MPLISEDVAAQLKQEFQELQGRVRLGLVQRVLQ